MPSLETDYRGTGRTTRLMMAAPRDAVFVCDSNGFARYQAPDLAAKVGRTDLKFIGPFLVIEAWRGTNREIVVDHDTKLDPRTLAEIDLHNALVRSRNASAAA